MTPRLQATLAGLTLGALALIAYANSFHAGLVLDNSAVILGDWRLRAIGWKELGLIFGRNYWWPNYSTNLYRPLTTLSYWFNYTVLGNGTSPLGYHVINVALHAANVLLLWRLALRVGLARGAAWCAAGIFAVHPLGVESVTNIVGRADLFATLAVLGGSLMWLRAEAAENRPARRGWRWGVGLTAFLAIFFKENGILVVAAIGLLVVWQWGWRAAPAIFLKRALPLVLAPTVAWIVIRLVMRALVPDYEESFTSNPLAYVGGTASLMTAIGVLGRYAGLCVWPATLSCDYSYAAVPVFGQGGWPDVVAAASLVAGLALVTVLWRLRARAPLVAGAVWWSALMMLPTSNLLVKIGATMAERFLYLPLTGLSVAAVATVALIAGRWAWPSWVGRALAAVVIAALTLRTLVRNPDWQDELSLWSAAVRAAPASFKAHKGLAVALAERGSEADLDAAIAEAELGMKVLDTPPLPIEQQDNSLWGDAGEYYRRKGEFALARGERDVARQWFQRSLVVLDRAFARDRWINAERQRQLREAGTPVAEIIEYGYPRVLTQRALTQIGLGLGSDALITIQILRGADPLNVDALLMLGHIELTGGYPEAAAVRYIEAMLIRPDARVALDALPKIYAQLGLGFALAPNKAGGLDLDLKTPRVAQQVKMAYVDIVKTLRAAKRTVLADEWTARGSRDFGWSTADFRR
jgi:tetratricopeptide (TPR) repeat protein